MGKEKGNEEKEKQQKGRKKEKKEKKVSKLHFLTLKMYRRQSSFGFETDDSLLSPFLSSDFEDREREREGGTERERERRERKD